MEVPDNNTFSLQDVVDSVNPTTDDLIDCFADAVTGSFNDTYNPNSDGSSNNLLNFRNYEGGSAAVNSYSIRAGSTATLACAGPFVTLFQRSTSFNFNDPIYGNSAGTIFAINSYYSNSQVSKSWDSGDWIGSPFLCSPQT